MECLATVPAPIEKSTLGSIGQRSSFPQTESAAVLMLVRLASSNAIGVPVCESK